MPNDLHLCYHDDVTGLWAKAVRPAVRGSCEVIRVGIVGVSGYGGGELVRILSGHPEAELTYLCSETYSGRDIGAALPNVQGYLRAECESYDVSQAVERCDVVFLAQQSGWAMKESGALLDAGLKVIDLSADFRLRAPGAYEEWYKVPHAAPELIERAVYGLPELYGGEIAGAQLVANPGCYPISAVLALAPLVKEKLADQGTIVIDSKSGASGAGRSSFKLDYHFAELNESMKAYNVGVHRHTPEIEQELGRLAGEAVTVSFTPHLIPITRGILTTVYAKPAGSATTEQLVQAYRQFYEGAPFVVVLDAGDYPATKDVFGSNSCHIGIKGDQRGGRVVVLSALDNLIKGMSGTAIQNMNLMCGLDEGTGLMRPGVYP